MQRRTFLKALGATSLATLGLAGNMRLARGAINGKTLVVIFQRGGCDGLNTVVPYGDPAYVGLRPSIGIAAPDATNPDSALDLNGYFGLHPALAPLHNLHQQGLLATLPAVHYDQPSRSHFDSQRWIESAQPESNIDGWLNRYLAIMPTDAPVRAISMGGDLAHALRGPVSVATVNDLGNVGIGSGGDGESLLQRLTEVYEQQANASDLNRGLIHQNGQTFLANLQTLAMIDIDGYVPANGASYPDSGYGEQLQQVAALIKEGVGLEAVSLNIGGWDTHSNQGGAQGRQAGRHAEFATGVEALATDLGPLLDDVMILTMTEFGRTARENASLGTDHGHASSWFLINGHINAGIHGSWPGLDTANLVNGRYLNHSIDFRDVMAEVMTQHLGIADVSSIIPDTARRRSGFYEADLIASKRASASRRLSFKSTMGSG